MKKNEIPERLTAMRQFLTENNIDAFIILAQMLMRISTKIYRIEKVDKWLCRSAGTAVVTKIMQVCGPTLAILFRQLMS